MFHPNYKVVALCIVCFLDVIDNYLNLFSIHLYLRGSFARKNSRKSWVFVTNVLKYLSPLVYLDFC